ncbi:MAG: hypothetical protein M0R17_07565 [Candidatus Omnitrophica bacterium]|jgi:hypothetical protein|nr:hypothetical protein [Candidatus Omnitrophota bacterium]
MNKIKVFLREWNGANKRKRGVRPDWFSYENCYQSITNEKPDIDLTILLDGTVANHHFQFNDNEKIIEFTGGNDATSLLFALNYIKSTNPNDDDIIYIVEDDYMHISYWCDILFEAFDTFTNVDYVTLYDHPDKYFLPIYDNLQSKILVSKSCHWRTTPSTCNTYAALWSTFKKHWNTHIKYSSPEFTHDGYDHTKFLDLWNLGSNLISPIPGYSTHCERQFISPNIDWSKI